MARKDKSLHHGIGTQCRVILICVHPSAPIPEKILIGPRTTIWSWWFISKSPRKLFAEVLQRYLIFFSHPDFIDGEFYAAKRYIHAIQEGAEEYLFDVPVPSVRRACQYVSVQVKEE